MKKYLILDEVFFLLTLAIIIFVPKGQVLEISYIPLIIAVSLVNAVYLLSVLIGSRKETFDIKTTSIIYAILFGLFSVWDLTTTVFNVVNPVLFPAPETVFYVYVDRYEFILTGVVQSLIKLLVGIALSLVFGTGIGLFIGWVPALRKVFFPICKVLSPIPPIVYTSYVVALMPNFQVAAIMVIFLGIFWPTILSTITSVSNIDRGIIITAKSMGIKDLTMMFKIILPFTLPATIENLTVTVSFSFMTLTSAEMLGSTAGLGFFVQKYAAFAMYDNVICGIITIGIVVVFLNMGIELLKKNVIKWA
jgi:NitT/TauT family transport system permease protein